MATILLIEDNNLLRALLALELEQQGYEVILFSDAAPALAEAHFDEVNLIITCLDMPTPGEEAIQTIRAQDITTPILVTSATLQPADEEYLYAIGAQRILYKPFKNEILLKAVDELLHPEENTSPFLFS